MNMLIQILFWFNTCLFLLCGSIATEAQPRTLACTDGTIYPTPRTEPIRHALLLVSDGVIQTAVDASAMKFTLPPGAQTINCNGKFIVAGFWNSHVHFETGWQDAGAASADKLTAHLQEMLTRWGFTTVWDLGSDPFNTFEIRRRVEAGDVLGPHILMAGDIFPEGGHPVYLPPEMKLPEAASPAQAEEMAKLYLKMGYDGIKLFTGAYMGNQPVINMPTAIVKAAVDVSHAQGKPVFTHPQNYAGVDNALNGGADILAHTIPTEDRFTPEELAQMKRQHTALIPTLTLWTTVVPDPAVQDQLVRAGVNELHQYFLKGGTILFGTDVGFQPKYDTSQEFEFMGRAMEILASLTTTPSRYFNRENTGRVEKGMEADFVVLDADPAADVRNFAKVAYTIRGGKIIYSSAR
jgi:imidazolonepropionase-like amidohydrolase